MSVKEGTTEIIRRRIRHWKTTVAGIATIASPVLVSIWPEHASTITAACAGLTGAGLIAAADASTIREKIIEKLH